MGKRYFDVSATELYNHDSLMSLDQGVGAATRDMRIVWLATGAATQTHFDIYTNHVTDANRVGNMQAHVTTQTGTVTGLVRVNYEDTLGIDRILAGLKAVREEMQRRGKWGTSAASGTPVILFTTDQVQENVIGALIHSEECFRMRGRAEGHCAANG
jgi:energy-converting hydrogenase Eha subunit A